MDGFAVKGNGKSKFSKEGSSKDTAAILVADADSTLVSR